MLYSQVLCICVYYDIKFFGFAIEELPGVGLTNQEFMFQCCAFCKASGFRSNKGCMGIHYLLGV